MILKICMPSDFGLKKIFVSLLLVSVYGFVCAQKEQFTIPWPTDMKIGSNQETPKQKMIEYVPAKESVEKWTIIGTMITFKGITGVDIDAAKEIMFSRVRKNAIDPVFTVIEKNDLGKNPWILFKAEIASYKNDPNPESQLYYIIQGDENLYNNIIATKEKTLSEDFTSKWSAIFKSGKLEK
jgi:hypothetical protein